MLLASFVAATLRADPVISEFMAENRTVLADEDGAFSDWIEVFNPDATAIDLNGWYLTDSASNKTRWQFPSVTLQPGSYLLVFASGKNRRSTVGRLHTNFSLDAGGEYLALVKPDGITVASAYAPEYPAQTEDVSYGLLPGSDGRYTTTAAYLLTPTPGTLNTGVRPPVPAETAAFSRPGGAFSAAFVLTLSGAKAGEEIRYTITPPQTGLTAPAPTSTSTVYSAPLTISASSVVRAAVFIVGTSIHGPVTTAYYPHIAPALGTFSSTLPVLVIDSLGSGPLVKDNLDHPAWSFFYTPHGAAPTFNASPDLVSTLTTSVRGATSADFPKKGFNLKFTDSAGDPKPVALIDGPAFEKWALVGPWKFDQSFLNNAFMYELSNRIGRWTARTRFVEVYFNTNGGDIDSADYAGIYVITDRIEVDKNRVNITALARSDTIGPAVTGGYILKIDAPATDELSWNTTHGVATYPDSALVLVAPEADGITPAQFTYLKDYVQRMENALYADRDKGWAQRTYLDYIDRASWIDHHILNVFSANPDEFQRSAYLMKDRNGKMVAGPIWDFDRALGSYNDARSYRYDLWQGLGVPDVWGTGWWGVIAQDPEFMQDWVDRWQTLRLTTFDAGEMRAVLDTLSANLGAAAARDAARWPDDASPYGTYKDQVEHLKGWVSLRGAWIDTQLVRPPTIERSGNNQILIPNEDDAAPLAYTTDGSDPRALGGGVAPNAIIATGRVTVPASANVHVRSYRAEKRGVFPGSPWSMAVGGQGSSPLTPRARIVNISSRATVGTGENALIAGVVVADTESKRYLSRGIGPALATFGASGIVPDPSLAIINGSGVTLFRNTGWGTGVDVALMPGFASSVGAFALPAGRADSALASVVTYGNYTMQVTTPSGRGGVGLAELYELDTNGRTINLSTRARVGTGDNVLIGGFVVSGPAYKRMLVRAVGPTLGVFGVAGFLADPVLNLRTGSTLVATNDRWDSDNGTAIAAASRSTGAFTLPAGSQDAALLITLPPNAYTVEIVGKNNTQGVALLEIYDVP